MSNDGIVEIHGKSYKTVAARVEEAHEGRRLFSVATEVLQHAPSVVIKATVNVILEPKDALDIRVFTGISAVALDTFKQIEKQSPYEVAETSAVGRALGFAGFGVIDSIASADEMVKAGATEQGKQADPAVKAKAALKERMDTLAAYELSEAALSMASLAGLEMPKGDSERGMAEAVDEAEAEAPKRCEEHDELMFQGTSKTKFDSRGVAKTYWYHKTPAGEMCFGN